MTGEDMRYDHFQERPRKVHLYHYQEGATYRSMGQTRRYADTLCKGNYDSPVLLSTTDPNKVTCKTCLKKMHGRPLPQPAPVVAIVPPAPKPIYIGPDYAAIRKRDWSAVHIAADNRRPFRFPPMSKADAERRDKGNWA